MFPSVQSGALERNITWSLFGACECPLSVFGLFKDLNLSCELVLMDFRGIDEDLAEEADLQSFNASSLKL